MKIYLDENISLNENRLMEIAIVNPRLCDQLTIQVEVEQRNEGPIPHVHVYHDKTRNPKKCSYVRLDKAEYCSFHGDAPTLPKDLKKEFVQLMTTIYVKRRTGEKVSGYEMAVDTWVETYEDDYDKFALDTDGKLVMPDYTQLK
ncbi:MAG: hypothetical protein K2O04_06915 [Clostridiales bacterium]|nr:hypothetical protein [Clostridiales bacterium]